MRTTDVVVVGAGPAGAAAAITLRAAGRGVIVVDKARFPRDKICGDGLTTLALRLCEQLGVDPTTVPSWQVVDEAVIRSPSGRNAVFPLPRGRGQYAAVASRAEFDMALVERARAVGASVLEGHRCTDVETHDHHVDVTVDDIGVIRARYLVAADGMWSPTRKKLGVNLPGYLGEWHAFRQYFRTESPAAKRLHVWFEPDLLPGYAWSFPLADGRVNVGFGVARSHPGPRGNELAGLWRDLLERPHVAEIVAGAEELDTHRAWPIPARVDDLALTVGRVLFVGDAAAATDPMTGEGIGQALLTGARAAEAITSAGALAPEIATARYEADVRADLFHDHHFAETLSRLLRYDKGARAAVKVAALTPWTRRNFARWLFEDYPRAIALHPRQWHRGALSGAGAYEGVSDGDR